MKTFCFIQRVFWRQAADWWKRSSTRDRRAQTSRGYQSYRTTWTYKVIFCFAYEELFCIIFQKELCQRCCVKVVVLFACLLAVDIIYAHLIVDIIYDITFSFSCSPRHFLFFPRVLCLSLASFQALLHYIMLSCVCYYNLATSGGLKLFRAPSNSILLNNTAFIFSASTLFGWENTTELLQL